jgi:hypothetical protein
MSFNIDPPHTHIYIHIHVCVRVCVHCVVCMWVGIWIHIYIHIYTQGILLLLLHLFGLLCFANKNKKFQLSYSWFQTSQMRGQWYSETSPFSIIWYIYNTNSHTQCFKCVHVCACVKCEGIFTHTDRYVCVSECAQYIFSLFFYFFNQMVWNLNPDASKWSKPVS